MVRVRFILGLRICREFFKYFFYPKYFTILEFQFSNRIFSCIMGLEVVNTLGYYRASSIYSSVSQITVRKAILVSLPSFLSVNEVRSVRRSAVV